MSFWKGPNTICDCQKIPRYTKDKCKKHSVEKGFPITFEEFEVKTPENERGYPNKNQQPKKITHMSGIPDLPIKNR